MGLNFDRSVVQSEYEIMVQRQTRMRNMVRSRIQNNGNSSCSFENRESSIIDTDLESIKHKNEYCKEEPMLDINTEHQTVNIKTTPEPQLEAEFYQLLNNLITDLNLRFQNNLPLL